jgi:hypothetical protein
MGAMIELIFSDLVLVANLLATALFVGFILVVTMFVCGES